MQAHRYGRRLKQLLLLGSALLAWMPAGVQALSIPSPTKPGDTGIHVRRLQQELRRRDFDIGGISGRYDDMTIKAVERYQRARDLPLSGMATADTLAALFAWIGSEAAPVLQPAGMEALRALPQPSHPGQQGSAVKSLQQALLAHGFPVEDAAGTYGVQTRTAVGAFQADHGLPVTGHADEATLRVLFTQPPSSPGDTTRPLWYGGASGLIPLGAAFEIKDVLTGAVFRAMRVHGTSHLDAEPLTAWDTDIMLRNYGGQWSWDRRAILLRYRDEVYAASMNGKPHGWEILPGNNMSGHFCVHFFQSRGNGSQRVDPDHMRQAVEAGYAQWGD